MRIGARADVGHLGAVTAPETVRRGGHFFIERAERQALGPQAKIHWAPSVRALFLLTRKQATGIADDLRFLGSP